MHNPVINSMIKVDSFINATTDIIFPLKELVYTLYAWYISVDGKN